MFEKLFNYIIKKPLLSAEDNIEYELLLVADFEDCE